MDKIFVAICVEELSYQQAVMSYISSSDYASKLIISFFSRKDSVMEYLASGEPLHLLLTTPALRPEAVETEGYAVVLLMDSDEEESEQSALQMYQPLDRLFAQALECYARLNPNAVQKFQRNRNTKIVSVYSSSGGVGKTTVALAAAHQLSLRDHRVLYLNLEAVSGSPLQQEAVQEDGISNVLYYMRNNVKQLPARFESIKKYDALLKFDHIYSPSNVRDLLEISEADTRKLLQQLVELGLYDTILVDMDCSLQERNLGILQESDCVYWIMQKGTQCRQKKNTVMKFLQRASLNERHFFDHIYGVGNKALVSMKEEGRTDPEILITLPYIPEWKLSEKVERYISSRHFNQFILRLLVDSKVMMV